MMRFVSLAAHEAVIRQLDESRGLLSRNTENYTAAIQAATEGIERMAARHAKELIECRAQSDAHAIQILENARAAEDRADRRYADLMASYRMLKLQGAVEVAPPAPRVEPKPVDAVEQAIVRYARDPSLVPKMRLRAAEERAAGASDEEIINNIRRGTRPAEEMAS